MGDIEDADPPVAKRMDDGEQLVDLRFGERACGLIHDEHLGIERQGLRDFHHLLLGDREPVQRDCRVDPDVQPSQDGNGVFIHLLFVQGEKPRERLPADEDVGSHRQVGNEVELLVDDPDAGIPCLGGIVEMHFAALEADDTLVRLVHAGKDLHERRLARPVFPHQGMNLALAEIKRDVVKGFHAGEALGYVFDIENYFLHARNLLTAHEGMAPA